MDEADAKRILTASSLDNWRSQLGRLHVMWFRTIQQDLKSKNSPRSTLAQLTTLAIAVNVWCDALLLVHARKEDDNRK